MNFKHLTAGLRTLKALLSPPLADVQPLVDFVSGEPSPLGLLTMRLRYIRYQPLMFNHVSVCRLKDKFIVFVVANEQAHVIEDGLDLFPSDKLIAQLLLLRG